jgi:glycosyltransferase involved in cell wall biosynthesis
MNILLVSYYSPIGEGGIEKQTIGFLQKLVEQGHQIGCLTVGAPDKVDEIHAKLAATGIFRLGNWVIPYVESPHGLKSKLMFWLTADPIQFLAKLYSTVSESIKQEIKNISQDNKIDVVHVHGFKTAYLFPNTLGLPTTIDLIDSWTLHKERSVKHTLNNRFNQVFPALVDYFKTRRIEKNLLQLHARHSAFVMIAQRDAAVLKKLYPQANLQVVSAGTNYQDLTADLNQYSDRKVIVFYGIMNQIHNIDTLRFLVHKIIPLVHRQHPDLRLEITGLHLSDEVLTLGNQFNWIEIIPVVEDISRFVGKATLMCWPFRYGAGVKTKIVESMMLGKAIVTTTQGSEAFTSAQAKGILVADTASGLAGHINQLLHNQDECVRLGKINRQIALSEFSWEQRAKKYENIYISAMK